MKNIYTHRYLVVFDNRGEIYSIAYQKGVKDVEHITIKWPYLVQTTDETIVWPDELKGDVSGIVAIVSASKQFLDTLEFTCYNSGDRSAMVRGYVIILKIRKTFKKCEPF